MTTASNTQLELLFKYPLLKQKSQEQNEEVYEGKIVCQYKIFNITVKHKIEDTKHHTYAITLDNLDKENKEIKEILEKSDFQNIIEVLDKVKMHLESKNKADSTDDATVIYRKVLNEYSEFTKFFLNLKTCQLKNNLTSISVSVLDEKHREHPIKIAINLTDKFEKTFHIDSYDLPKPNLTENLFEPNDSLTVLFDQFLAQIEILQPYFDLMDEIDSMCSILDPDIPKKGDVYRRLWLGENISLIITVDPHNVSKRPDLRFLGPDRLVDSYRTRLNENLGNWSCHNGVIQGILDLLALETFPQKPELDTKSNLLVEYGVCSICFCLRCNDQLPQILCKNPSCEKFYHVECLYEVISLNGRRIYNEIFGKCPICEKNISCPIPTT